MLYTTYLSKINKIPAGVKRLLVMRFPPKKLDPEKHGVLLAFDLAPSEELLKKQKAEPDWVYYTFKFRVEMASRKDMVKKLDEVLARLKQGEDICFICCEKKYIECHRWLLAQWFIERGIEWKEI